MIAYGGRVYAGPGGTLAIGTSGVPVVLTPAGVEPMADVTHLYARPETKR